MPIIIAGLAQNFINITDTAFLGRVDEVTLAAAAIGSIYYFLFAMLCMGMAVGVQIIIARRCGENNEHQTGFVFDQGVYLLLIFASLLFVFMKINTSFILEKVLQSEAVLIKAKEFLNFRMFGIWTVALNMAFRSFYIGLSKTKVLTWSTLTMAIVNIVFDYLLIFGNFGFPEAGIKGAATASFLAEISALIFFLNYTVRKLNYRSYNIFSFLKWNFNQIKQILNLSYPTVFQNLFSFSAWFSFFIIIEQTGEQNLAVSNILRALLIFFMIPVWGLATSANTMCSNIIGQGKADSIMKIAGKIIMSGSLIMMVLLQISFLKPEWVISIITHDDILIAAVISPLNIVNFALIIFVPSVILFHALMGTGDTKAAFLIETVGVLSYLGYAILISLKDNPGLESIWIAEIIYWGLIGLISFFRLKNEKWKRIAV